MLNPTTQSPRVVFFCLFCSPERQKFVDNLSKRNEVKALNRSDNTIINDRYLILSTCQGAAGTSKRLAVVAKLVAEELVY